MSNNFTILVLSINIINEFIYLWDISCKHLILKKLLIIKYDWLETSKVNHIVIDFHEGHMWLVTFGMGTPSIMSDQREPWE